MAETALTTDLLTIADYEKITSGKKDYELWNGELVKLMSAGMEHNYIAMLLARLLLNFSETKTGLIACNDNNGFLLTLDPDTLLSPDAALVRKGGPRRGPWFGKSPDLAVEIRSPSDTSGQMQAKKDKYLAAGSEQVWIVDPLWKTIEVHFSDGRSDEFAGDSTFVGSGIVEGLTFPVSSIFVDPFA